MPEVIPNTARAGTGCGRPDRPGRGQTRRGPVRPARSVPGLRRWRCRPLPGLWVDPSLSLSLSLYVQHKAPTLLGFTLRAFSRSSPLSARFVQAAPPPLSDAPIHALPLGLVGGCWIETSPVGGEDGQGDTGGEGGGGGQRERTPTDLPGYSRQRLRASSLRRALPLSPHSLPTRRRRAQAGGVS